jgi:hypothetical protein
MQISECPRSAAEGRPSILQTNAFTPLMWKFNDRLVEIADDELVAK